MGSTTELPWRTGGNLGLLLHAACLCVAAISLAGRKILCIMYTLTMRVSSCSFTIVRVGMYSNEKSTC